MAKERLFLIDGMSHVYRSFFAIRGLSTSKGLPTNAIYGFAMMLRKLINEDKPEYLVVCMDTPEPTFRHDAYAEYKIHRALPPDDMIPQFPYVEKLCKAMSVPLIKMPGYEADDVIGTLARLGASAGLQVIIVSNDKDMCQLVNDNVSILKSDKTHYALCNAEEVKKRLGVKPEQVVDLLGLMGDSSDNVPGAPGIGEKGAVQIIEEFGSIDEALMRWEEVKRKTYRESLRDNAEQIRLSKRLVTIETELPIEFDLDVLRTRKPDYKAAYELFSELEFRPLMREYAEKAETDSGTSIVSPILENSNLQNLDYRSVSTQDDLNRLINSIWSSDGFAFVIAGRSGALNGIPISKLSISLSPGSADVLDFEQSGIDYSKALSDLRDIWTNGIVQKTTYDAKTALSIINAANGNETIYFDGITDDVLLAAYLINPEQSSKYGLIDLAQEYLSMDPVEAQATDQADLSGRLAPVLRRKLAELELENLYMNFELPLVDILYDMERTGVAIDTEALSELSIELDKMIGKLTKEIYELAGEEFNINSTVQLGKIFEKLNLDTASKTKTGKMSTRAHVLEELAEDFELPRKILEYRELAKLKNTYVDTLPKLINPKTGRVHTTFNQASVATGRLSSTNPNLQNIPVRTEIGKRIRKAFIAGEGYLLLSADYSQIELRLLAHITKDPIMLEAFQNGEDIHTKTAREVFGAKTEEELKSKRRLAKATNFGIAYGVGAFGLSQNVGITRREAKEAIEIYYATYKGIRRYMAELPEASRKDGIVRTLFGRIRRLPDLNNQNRNLRARAEREAINAPIQGTASDLVKLAMIKILRRLRSEGFKARLLLQVHDELLFEVPPDEAERVKEIVKSEMENVHKLDVPLLVEVQTGKNWMELK